MYKITTAFMTLVLWFFTGPVLAAHHEKNNEDSVSAYEEILNSDARDENDRTRDISRKPAAVLAKMGIGPGDTLIDIGGGGGYYAEIFARVVGQQGNVFVINTQGAHNRFPNIAPDLEKRRAKPGVEALQPMTMEFDEVPADFQADFAFLGQMYHEVILNNMDGPGMNKAVYAALKPGGKYVIEIHLAPEGSGREVSEAYHRTDPSIVRAEVLAAGFELVEEDTELFANPDDPLNILVFDPSVRGKTARTVFVFQKPQE